MTDPSFATGEWRFTIHALDGRPVISVPAVSGRWARRISDIPGGNHVLMVRGQDIPKATLKAITVPNTHYMVQSWRAYPNYPDTPMFAGRITDAVFSRDAGTLTVNSIDVRSFFSKRHTVKVGGYDPQGAWEVTNQTVQGLAREAIAGAVYDPSITDYNLIVRLSPQLGGTESLRVPNYEFSTWEDVLREIEARPDGPDIELEPRFDSDTKYLYFEGRIGTPRFYDAGTADFPMNVDVPPFTEIEVTYDGTEVVTHGFAVGSGSGEDIPVQEAGATGTTVPFMQTIVKVDSTDLPEMQARVQAEVDTNREPTEEWAMKTLASYYPVITNLRLGTILRLHFVDDEWEEDGWKELYLIGISGDHTEKLTLEVQLLEALS